MFKKKFKINKQIPVENLASAESFGQNFPRRNIDLW